MSALLKPRPNPLRLRISCPDCGFDCPRCQVHYSEEDFWAEHEQKTQAMYHNHAQADLTSEEDE